MTKMVQCSLEGNEFELRWRYYFHCRSNNLGENAQNISLFQAIG